ncbi:MAG: hypothetical protein AAF250_16235 [Pseudomonadota bacterium]
MAKFDFNDEEIEEFQRGRELFERAVKRVTLQLQTEIGMRLESIGCEFVEDGAFDSSGLTDGEVEEFRQLLFACHVIESSVGSCPTPHFPDSVAALKAHLLPELASSES